MKARTLALSAVLSVTFATATLADDRHGHRKGRDDHQLYYPQDYRNHNDSHSHRADNRCKIRYGYSHRSSRHHHDDYRYGRRDDAYTAVNVVVGALALNEILHHARH